MISLSVTSTGAKSSQRQCQQQGLWFSGNGYSDSMRQTGQNRPCVPVDSMKVAMCHLTLATHDSNALLCGTEQADTTPLNPDITTHPLHATANNEHEDGSSE